MVEGDGGEMKVNQMSLKDERWRLKIVQVLNVWCRYDNEIT